MTDGQFVFHLGHGRCGLSGEVITAIVQSGLRAAHHILDAVFQGVTLTFFRPLALDQGGKGRFGGLQGWFSLADFLVNQFNCERIADAVFGACVDS